MSTFKRYEKWILIGLAVFLLIIFSVTAAMTTVLSSLLGDDESGMATLELEGSTETIGLDEYHRARNLLDLQQRVPYLGPLQGRPTKEDIVAFALLRRVADQNELWITDGELQDYLLQALRLYRVDYETFYNQRHGYPTAANFERDLREVMRISKVQEILTWAASPTTEEVLEWWSERYKEFNLDYLVWTPEEFTSAAETEAVDEEALQTFFDEGLSPAQTAKLEREERIPFEALILSADALSSPAVQEWAAIDEPTPVALKGFYDFHRASRYLQDLPDEGEQIDPNQSPFKSIEELGDQLVIDYKLNAAIMAVLPRLNDVSDMQEFATQMGLEFLFYEDAVPRSDLIDLERIGATRLDDMFRSTPDQWMAPPVLVDDLAVLVRPGQVIERALPALEEIRDEVVELWREKRRDELVLEAAEKFLEGLPRPEGYIEGDPILLDAAAFAAAARKAGKEVRKLDWISSFSRPTVDPIWDKDDKVTPWARITIGRTLDEVLVEQAVGPFQHPTQNDVVVGRIGGVRNADVTGIWPGELQQARNLARTDSIRKFIDEKLSYEGLSRAYDIQMIVPEEEAEEEDFSPPAGQ